MYYNHARAYVNINTRMLIEHRSEGRCEASINCNGNDFIGKRQIHHKDKNSSNNEIDNLMSVCKKCHDSFHQEKDNKRNSRLYREDVYIKCLNCNLNYLFHRNSGKKFCSMSCKIGYARKNSEINKEKRLQILKIKRSLIKTDNPERYKKMLECIKKCYYAKREQAKKDPVLMAYMREKNRERVYRHRKRKNLSLKTS